MFRIDWARDWYRLSVMRVDYGNGAALWVSRRGLGTGEPVQAPVCLIDEAAFGLDGIA